MSDLPREIDAHLTPRVPVATAAKYLGCSARTVLRMIAHGTLPAIDTSPPEAVRPRWAIAVRDLRAYVVEAELAAERRLEE